MNRFANLRPATFAHKSIATNRLNQHIASALQCGLLASAVAVLSAGAAQAQQPAVRMSQPDATSLRLRFDNPTQRPACLTVVNLSSGESILTENHREMAYGTRLKFDKLPAGAYAVLLRMGRNRYRYTVQVAADAAGQPAIAVRETTTHRVESGLATAQL